MKKLFLGMIAITLMASPVLANGGKKKAKKKAKMECAKKCDPQNCDPKNCDPKDCTKDPKCVNMPGCTKK